MSCKRLLKRLNISRYNQFDTVDPESDQHWNEKIKHAWQMFDKVNFQSTEN